MLSTIERVLFLRSVTLFARVPDEVLAWVAQTAHEVEFAPGERFIREGDPGDSLYIVIHGDVEIALEGKGRIATRGPKSVLGEMAILVSRPRTASCVAATPVYALQIARDDFLHLLAENPELALGIIGELVNRLDDLSRRVAELSDQPGRVGPSPA